MSKRISNFVKNHINPEVESYDIDSAFAVISEYAKSAQVKFPESLNISIKLGIDTKKSDQMIKGLISLPHGTGKKVKIAVFATGKDVENAIAAGATVAGSEDLIEKVKGGFLDFDKCIATPEMMPKLAQLARTLGPRGLMPNPKLGTVTNDIAGAVKEFMLGKVEFRTSKEGVVALSIGKANMKTSDLKANFETSIKALKAVKPQSLKGNLIKSIHLSTTMSGFGLKLEGF